MDISRKTDYALRMLAALVRDPSGVVSVRAVADDNGIPYSFARSIQHDLARAGIVESLRGAHGGMKLAVDQHKTTLCELIEAIQGPIEIATCDFAGHNGGPCPFRSECNFNPIWCNAEWMLKQYFRSVSLYDVVVDNMMPSPPREFPVVEYNHAK